MNAWVARLSGRIAMVLGFAFVGFGVLGAFYTLAVDVPWGQLTEKALLEQSMTIVLLNVAGLMAGLPLVILGQILVVLLRQSDVLERIAQALAKHQHDPAIRHAQRLGPPEGRLGRGSAESRPWVTKRSSR